MENKTMEFEKKANVTIKIEDQFVCVYLNEHKIDELHVRWDYYLGDNLWHVEKKIECSRGITDEKISLNEDEELIKLRVNYEDLYTGNKGSAFDFAIKYLCERWGLPYVGVENKEKEITTNDDINFEFDELVRLSVMVELGINELQQSIIFWHEAIKNPNKDETDEMKANYKKYLSDSEEDLKKYNNILKKLKRVILAYNKRIRKRSTNHETKFR